MSRIRLVSAATAGSACAAQSARAWRNAASSMSPASHGRGSPVASTPNLRWTTSSAAHVVCSQNCSPCAFMDGVTAVN
ncbi:hypothetical protein [Lentzea kentuckyensis]|uniref:hypothetical protein n=1 Tax=Lentzea kentuckyensis TaxID=360086 RepID=UPI001FEB8038|nr:hypothetical protein [Lentzea kentuckyensis]